MAKGPSKRPRIYDSARHPLLARALARDGMIDKEIAKALGVGIRTLHEWKQFYPEFAEALKEGKDEVDIKVENALLKRALGYDYVETETSTNPVSKQVIRVKVTNRHVIPETVACIFWLKNRRPDVWRDRHEIGGPNGGPIPVKLYDFDESKYPDPQPSGDGK